VVTLAACGETADNSAPDQASDKVADRPAAASDIPTVPTPTGKVTGLGLVIKQGDRIEFCLGPVAESSPPQCDGIPLEGWAPSASDYFDKAGGVQSGMYAVTGTFDGATMTVTDDPIPAALYDPAFGPAAARETSTRCDEPTEGWSVVNRSKATAQALERAEKTAMGLDGYVTHWSDRFSGRQMAEDEGTEPDLDPDRGDGRLDQLQLVLNVQVTGDVEKATKLMRTVWGGALCVSNPEHDKAELDGIVADLQGETGILSVVAQADRVVMSVLFDDGTLQEYLDETYGVDTVVVTSALQKIE
jgi:hypothetical protein